MAKGFREYIYKGWQIRASEYYGDWECQPAFYDDKLWENFINNEEVRFRTLKEAKAWVSTDEAKKLKDKYSKI